MVALGGCVQVRVKENSEEFGSCGCGRSPTGKCCGWHGLTEEQYKQRLSDYEFEQYKNQAQQLWNDSCTSERKQK